MKRPNPKNLPMVQTTKPPSGGSADQLVGDIRSLIENARGQVAQAVNAGLVTLYWSIGDRIRRETLGQRRAEYGQQIVETLSKRLVSDYGAGFSRANLFHMLRFSETFPNREIVYTLCRQLGWSHFRQIIYFSDPLQRDFYAEMCRLERWSVRTLRSKIQGMLYERTGISKKPADLLFYHRRLHRLVAIDLKLGRFQAADKGQMELYLRWLEKHEKQSGENPPLGLILCADKSVEHVELLQLERSGIRVAQYLTELPPRKILEEKLHQAIRLAREQLASHQANALK